MKTRNRRGMLLLVVLALLAMFAMLAVAFVVMTGSERGSAEKLKTIESQNDPPAKTLDAAAAVVARGTAVDPNMVIQPTSAITWQNLMEHIYGGETIGTLKNPCTLSYSSTMSVCNGQLLEFALPLSNPGIEVYGPNTPVDPFHCVGCVLTMVDGPAAGLSTRIVSINPNTYNVQICAFEGGVSPVTASYPTAHYIVNGFPYSGMGFGFSNTAGSLTAMALLPNSPPSAWAQNLSASNGIIPGGVNSDHTAADYQDPLVGLASSDGSGGVIVPIPSMHRSDLIEYWIKNNSLGISQYADFGKSAQNVSLLRQIMFRPIGKELLNSSGSVSQFSPNPSFTGSNPNFNPLWDGITPGQGQWDVDNMGTGRPDSVWVDLGFPVRFTQDGHAYKPLFAILCLDLDGRLNLNAHGSLAQSNPNYYQPQNVQTYTSVAATVGPGGYQPDTGVVTATGAAAYFAGPVGQQTTRPPVALPRGQGTGPAEVNLLPLFREPAGGFSFTNYQYLLSGSSLSNPPVMGRYGGPSIGAALPGIDGTGSYLTMNNAFPFSGVLGGNYWTSSGGNLDAYGTPPDYQTMGAIGLDTAGRALYISTGGSVANGPYDSDLTRNAAHAVDVAPMDNAFGVDEMERILRVSDRDATTLPKRLLTLTLSDPNNPNSSLLIPRRAEFTVESNSVPVSAAVLPPSLRKYLTYNRSVHPVDILYAQVTKNMNLAPAKGAQLAQGVIAQLLPWEVMEGLKMDVNRPFGAGAFSLKNSYQGTLTQGGAPSIPDQPGTTNEHLPQFVSTGSTAAAAFNYSADAGVFSKDFVNGNPVPINDSLAARRLYARHLYILALALADVDAIRQNWFSGTTDPEGPDGAMKRMLAQWAVNVVAYRDHNNIMIPFSYDLYPFGNPATNKNPGWAPDYTPQHTVWGCKRPSLLLTETIAFHDRKTQDLNDETVDSTKPGRSGKMKPGFTHDTGDMKDPSFNSRYRPQGSLFVELFNPWPLTEPQTPDLATPAIAPGVELTKVAPASGNAAASPVWRMIIVNPANQTPAVLHPNGDELPDPDSPIIANRPTIERFVYFVPTSSAPNAPAENAEKNSQVYSVSTGNWHPLVVAPGGYAVIGSGDPNQANQTYIGFEVGQTTGHPATTRMVDLKGVKGAGPNSNYTVPQPVVKNAGGGMPSAAPVPVLAIDSPRRLSISEPTGGYVTIEGRGPKPVTVVDPATGKYSSTADIPIDEWRDPNAYPPGLGKEPGIWAIINNDGTQGGFRIIYLQRLADPTRPFVSDTNANPQMGSSNPYRTIDAMTVDLTCFNGMTQAKDPTLSPGAPRHFESRQRGEKNWWQPPQPPQPTTSAAEMDLWKQEPAAKGNSLARNGWQSVGWSGGGAPATKMNFSDPLNQSLGYLNVPFGAPGNNPLGDPQYPFPLLNWAYRPFNNVYELLLVPTVSSSRLFARNGANPRQNFGYVDGAVRKASYQGSTYVPPAVYDSSASNSVPYPHLLNFFESQQSSAAGTSAQLHRLFYYLGVPSRFANTQLQMRADNAGQNTWTHWFHTPYNRISRYREPGMINLNTVTSSDVLFGAMDMYPLLQNNQEGLNAAFWDKFVRSRRGDGANSLATDGSQTLQYMFGIPGITPGLNPPPGGIAPSRFMRPYRTPGGASLAAVEPAREADVTLLRPDPDVVIPNTKSTSRPLYEVDDYLVSTGTTNAGGTPDQFPLACMDFNRSPNFRYQLLEKLGSTVSNHSNVFAIWITVGYFEAMPAPNGVDAAHPDGYQLGQELGADTGDVVRHRAFYIFDRSLPVGYIRGQDVNTSKAFLLQRFIE